MVNIRQHLAQTLRAGSSYVKKHQTVAFSELFALAALLVLGLSFASSSTKTLTYQGSLHHKAPVETYNIRSAEGAFTAELTFAEDKKNNAVNTMTLALHDDQGTQLAFSESGSPVAIFNEVNKGEYRITVSTNDSFKGNSDYTLKVTVPASDTVAPSVSIDSPGNDATVSDTISIIVTASDDVAVDRVIIQIDNGAIHTLDNTESWEYSLDTTTLNDGAHTALVTAYDTSENVTSTSVSFTVENSTHNDGVNTDDSENTTVSDYLWISPSTIADLPTSGDAWQEIVDDANRLPADGGGASVGDQNSRHDQYTLAAALACVRTNETSYCDKATGGLLDAIGTETDDRGRWLAVGRNVGAYTIAADIMDLRADGDPNSDGSQIEAWLSNLLERTLADNNDPDVQEKLIPFESGSNASAQEGFVYIAIAAYLDDQTKLDIGWDAFRTYACDPTAPDNEDIDLAKGVEYGWAHDGSSPCAINPLNTTKESVRIDGAIINDMRRGGYFTDPPGYTQYPWVGLEGFVPAAVVLQRSGYPAFDVADQAVLRTFQYLDYLKDRTGDTRWFDGNRAAETIQIVNTAYGENFLISVSGIGDGRTFGYTDWTHTAQSTIYP